MTGNGILTPWQRDMARCLDKSASMAVLKIVMADSCSPS